MNYENPKSRGSRASLTNGNPLAFNGAIRKRTKLIAKQDDSNSGGLMNKSSDWENPPTGSPKECCLTSQRNALLKEAGYVLAQIEQRKFTQIGRKPKGYAREHRELHHYFGSSSTRWAFCSYLFQRYYENQCFKKMEVTSHLDISSKATLQLVNWALEHGVVEWEHGKCYRVTELFGQVYMEYMEMQTNTLMSMWAKMSVFMVATYHMVKGQEKEEVTSHLTSQT
jgi:hypothetical protein